jgi:hypothetical protein
LTTNFKGHPGSGKSVLMHKLLEVFGGLNKNKKDEMIKVLMSNNATPVLINLKNYKKSLLVTYSISIFSLPAFSFTSFSVLVGLVPFNVISLLE